MKVTIADLGRVRSKDGLCGTCFNARLYGARGVCRRPRMGSRTLLPISDPFLPTIRTDDTCGDWMRLVDRKNAKRGRDA